MLTPHVSESPGGPLNQTAVGEALDSARISPRFWYLIGMVGVLALWDVFDASSLSYALPAIVKEFKLTLSDIGWIGSATLWGAAFGSFIWGWLADRWGRRLALVLAVLLFGLLTGLTGIAASVAFLLGARFLAGLGIGGMTPIGSAFIAETTPTRVRGSAVAIVGWAAPVGILFAALLGRWIVPNFGWRWLFAIGAIPIAFAILAQLTLPESPRWLVAKFRPDPDRARVQLRSLGISDSAIDVAATESAKLPAAQVPPAGKLSDLLAPEFRRTTLLLFSAWFLFSFAGWGFNVFLPTIYVQVYHISLLTTLNYTILIACAMLVSRAITVTIIDRVGRKPLMLFGAVTAGICAYALQYATTESSLVILAALYAGLLDFVLLPTQVYAAELYPARIRATGCAWVGAFGRIGGACAPTVVGYVLGWSNVSGLWLLMGTVTLVGGVLIFFIKQETAQVSLEVVSKGAAAA